MKNAKQIYQTLLRLYPRSYQETFGAEMLQTFLDHYADIEESQGDVTAVFWLTTLTDEIQNIAEQHKICLGERNFRKVSTVKRTIVAALIIPLYVVFYAVFVRVSLALPHPHISGIGVLIALAALILLPGILSVKASFALANVLTRRNIRIA